MASTKFEAFVQVTGHVTAAQDVKNLTEAEALFPEGHSPTKQEVLDKAKEIRAERADKKRAERDPHPHTIELQGSSAV